MKKYRAELPLEFAEEVLCNMFGSLLNKGEEGVLTIAGSGYSKKHKITKIKKKNYTPVMEGILKEKGILYESSSDESDEEKNIDDILIESAGKKKKLNQLQKDYLKKLEKGKTTNLASLLKDSGSAKDPKVSTAEKNALEFLQQ